MEFLTTQLGPLNLWQWAAVLVVGSVAMSSGSKFLKRKESAVGGKLQAASCIGCGWKGNVSKYHRQCPKCGNSITRMSRG